MKTAPGRGSATPARLGVGVLLLVTRGRCRSHVARGKPRCAPSAAVMEARCGPHRLAAKVLLTATLGGLVLEAFPDKTVWPQGLPTKHPLTVALSSNLPTGWGWRQACQASFFWAEEAGWSPVTVHTLRCSSAQSPVTRLLPWSKCAAVPSRRLPPRPDLVTLISCLLLKQAGRTLSLALSGDCSFCLECSATKYPCAHPLSRSSLLISAFQWSMQELANYSPRASLYQVQCHQGQPYKAQVHALTAGREGGMQAGRAHPSWAGLRLDGPVGIGAK